MTLTDASGNTELERSTAAGYLYAAIFLCYNHQSKEVTVAVSDGIAIADASATEDIEPYGMYGDWYSESRQKIASECCHYQLQQ